MAHSEAPEPRTAWVERSPRGEFVGISLHRPGTNGIPNMAAGHTVEEMPWDAAFKVAHERCAPGCHGSSC